MTDHSAICYCPECYCIIDGLKPYERCPRCQHYIQNPGNVGDLKWEPATAMERNYQLRRIADYLEVISKTFGGRYDY